MYFTETQLMREAKVSVYQGTNFPSYTHNMCNQSVLKTVVVKGVLLQVPYCVVSHIIKQLSDLPKELNGNWLPNNIFVWNQVDLLSA